NKLVERADRAVGTVDEHEHGVLARAAPVDERRRPLRTGVLDRLGLSAERRGERGDRRPLEDPAQEVVEEDRGRLGPLLAQPAGELRGEERVAAELEEGL